jgi:hypothetical protein
MFETVLTFLQTPTTVGLPLGVFVILGLWVVPFLGTAVLGRSLR